MKHRKRRRMRTGFRQCLRTDRDGLKEDIMRHFFSSVDAGYPAHKVAYTPFYTRRERALYQQRLREQKEQQKEHGPQNTHPDRTSRI